MNILIVEDEEELSSYLQSILARNGYKSTVAECIEEVITEGLAFKHDLIILDLMLNGERGDKLVKHLREKENSTPVLVLSALGQIRTKIQLINLGADDYLVKPFDPEELLARVKALHRRSARISELRDEEKFGDLTYFHKQKKVLRGNKEILLTKQENLLFEFLLRNNGKVVPTDDILKKVWKNQIGYHSNIIPATVRRLRQKLDEGFEHPLIRNVHGVGYILLLEDDVM